MKSKLFLLIESLRNEIRYLGSQLSCDICLIQRCFQCTLACFLRSFGINHIIASAIIGCSVGTNQNKCRHIDFTIQLSDNQTLEAPITLSVSSSLISENPETIRPFTIDLAYSAYSLIASFLASFFAKLIFFLP